MMQSALDGYADRVRLARSLAYDTAILPLMKNIPSRSEYLGDDETGGAAQTPEDMFDVMKAMGATVTIEDED